MEDWNVGALYGIGLTLVLAISNFVVGLLP